MDRAIGTDAKQPSLLAGLIFDETGERLSPSHAVKKGTRYRYYVSRSLIVGAAKDKPGGRRIPAGNLESLVINKLRDFLVDQGAILDAIDKQHMDGAQQNRLISRGHQIAEELPTMAPDRIRAMLMALLSRVDLKTNQVEIAVRRSCLIELLNTNSTDLTILADTPEYEGKDILTLKVPARLQRVGREMKMLVENSDDQAEADPGLLRILARAHDLQELVMQNKWFDPARPCQPRACYARLYLAPPAPSFARARHHYGDHQRQESAPAHGQETHAPCAGIARRLDRAAPVARLPISDLTCSRRRSLGIFTGGSFLCSRAC